MSDSTTWSRWLNPLASDYPALAEDIIFLCMQVRELVNLQNVNGKAKPYQVRQFFQLVEKYNLQLGDEA